MRFVIFSSYLFVLVMGCSKAEETPAADKKAPGASGTPTLGRAVLSADQRCYDFDADAVKQKGWAWAKAAKPDQATLEADVACAKEKRVGTCTVDTIKIRYYDGDRTGGAWTPESAKKACGEVNGTFAQ